MLEKSPRFLRFTSPLISTTHTIILVALSLIVFLVVAGSILITLDYRTRLHNAEQITRNSAIIYHDHIHLMMSVVEGAIRATINELHDNSDPDQLHDFLESVVGSYPTLRTMIVVDSEGVIVADSRPDELAVGIDVSDRQYIIVHQQQWLTSLYVDDPVMSRVDEAWSIPISTAIRDDSGNILYYIVASIEPLYFTGIFAGNDLPQSNHGFITNKRGVVLASIPFTENHISSEIVNYERYLVPQIERTYGHLFEDHPNYIIGYEVIQPYDILVIFGIHPNDFLQPFYMDAALVVVVVLVLSGGIFLTARYQLKKQTQLLEEVKERQRAEAALQQMNMELELRVKERTAVLKVTNQRLQEEIMYRLETEENLAQNHEKLRSILDSANVPILVLDKLQLKPLYYNQAMIDLEAVINVQAQDKEYTTEEIVEKLLIRIARSENGSLEIERANGEPMWLLHSTQSIEFDKADAMLLTLVDISLQHQAELELERSLEKAHELNRMKTQFVSMVSHEFRNPLTVIQTSLDLLRRYHDRLSPEKRLAKMDMIQRQIDRLDNFTEEVSFINKKDLIAHRLRIQQFDVIAVLNQVTNDVQLAHQAHNRIVMEVTGNEIEFATDVQIFQQIIVNLLSNAVKYSPDDTLVKLACQRMPDKLQIIVSDHGIGIPKTDQENLFEIFHRAGNVGQVNGSGLGLAIVKSSVEALRGTIEFHSEEGVGTTFKVCLPNLGVKEAEAVAL